MRWVAASALGEVGQPAVEPLVLALEDETSWVRKCSAEALDKIGWIPEEQETSEAIYYYIAQQDWLKVAGFGEPALKPLLDILVDTTPEIHNGTTWALGMIGAPAIDPLIKMLADDHSGRRWGAKKALKKIGEPAIKPLLRAFQDDDRMIRNGAAETLSDMGKAAEDPLIRALKDENSMVRMQAAVALGRRNYARELEPLLDALSDKNKEVRNAVIGALSMRGYAEEIGPIIDVIRNEERFQQLLALELKNPRQAEFLIKDLKSKDRHVRWVSAEALNNIDWEPRNIEDKVLFMVAKRDWEAVTKMGAPAVEPLILGLQEEDSWFRWEAARLLGEIGDVRALKPLIETLDDESSLVRGVAADSLGKLKIVDALPSLVRTLRDEDIWVRWVAVEALGNFGPTAIETLIMALKNEMSSIRRGATRALEISKDKEAIKPLVQTISDQDLWVQRGAAEALSIIGVDSIEPLIQIFRDGDNWVQWVTADALSKIGTPAVKPLLKSLDDPNLWVRRGSAEALGKIGDYRAVAPLLKMLRDKSSLVRRSAANGLGRIGWTPVGDDQVYYLIAKQNWEEILKIGMPAEKHLITMLNDENITVRSEASKALEKIRKATPK